MTIYREAARDSFETNYTLTTYRLPARGNATSSKPNGQLHDTECQRFGLNSFNKSRQQHDGELIKRGVLSLTEIELKRQTPAASLGDKPCRNKDSATLPDYSKSCEGRTAGV